jgi:hypothetical protein
VDRLPPEAEQSVADVPPAPALGEGRRGRRGQAEGIVQLAVGEQAPIRGDPGPVELELSRRSKVPLSGGSLASPVASAIPHPSGCYYAFDPSS